MGTLADCFLVNNLAALLPATLLRPCPDPALGLENR